MSTAPRIIALVPAHNEQRLIGVTIKSLFEQRVPPTRVLVIGDNCTDDTISVVRGLMATYPTLDVMETKNNTAKKAGALNQGIATLMPNEWDFVLQMDSDTLLDSELVKEALLEFGSNPNLGGVCSRCGVAPLEEGASRWARLLWRYQNIEYGIDDSYRIERRGKIKVLAGAVTLYRMDVLKKVSKKRSCDGRIMVWEERSLVEDYTLTLDVREMGYDALAGVRMYSWTDVPLTIRGPRGLLKQRDRWYGGTQVELRKRRFSPLVRKERLIHAFRLLAIGFKFLYLSAMVFLLSLIFFTDMKISDLQMHPLTILMVPIALSNVVQRGKYIQGRDRVQSLMVYTLLPMELYMLWDDFLVLRSYKERTSW